MVNTNKIKARMVELGLTQGIAAKQMGIDYSTLNQKINNKKRFFADEVGKLCKILKITTHAELKEYFGLDFLIVSSSCENDTKEMLGGA